MLRRPGMYARSWPYHVLQIAEGLALQSGPQSSIGCQGEVGCAVTGIGGMIYLHVLVFQNDDLMMFFRNRERDVASTYWDVCSFLALPRPSNRRRSCSFQSGPQSSIGCEGEVGSAVGITTGIGEMRYQYLPSRFGV
jgi:hypothetical protein